jgi:alpha-L-rhamnosidase
MGEIRSEWRYENDRILMNIAVPVPAEIMLPDGGKYQVKAGAYSYEVSL